MTAKHRRSAYASYRAEPVLRRFYATAQTLAEYARQRLLGRMERRDRYPLRAEDEPYRAPDPCRGCRKDCDERGNGC
jgi:hypothetical protein